MDGWMDGLMTLQHKNKICYRVSNKGIYMKCIIVNDTTKNAIKLCLNRCAKKHPNIYINLKI